MQHILKEKSTEKATLGIQTTEKIIEQEELLDLQSQNHEMAKKIESLEKNLFNSELKCIELNQMIKSCYNEVEYYTESKDKRNSIEPPLKNKHRIVSVIENTIQARHRSNSQEEDLRAKPSPQKLSLINIINYKSRLNSHSKTPTQKHSINSFNFPTSIKKKMTSPVPRF